jgi:hypothetical protein
MRTEEKRKWGRSSERHTILGAARKFLLYPVLKVPRQVHQSVEREWKGHLARMWDMRYIDNFNRIKPNKRDH